MNECVRVWGGRYWQGNTEVEREKYFTVWMVGELMFMEHGGMILTGEISSTEKKLLYKLVCR